jgi:16S rRNA (guanine966-N2)-methyltransferase
MADKIREALFSMLASLQIRPRRVLDLYAGSGAIGIEALSRGAQWVDFVDMSSAACAVIRQNLENTGFRDRAAVHCMPVRSFLARVREPYDCAIVVMGIVVWQFTNLKHVRTQRRWKRDPAYCPLSGHL